MAQLRRSLDVISGEESYWKSMRGFSKRAEPPPETRKRASLILSGCRAIPAHLSVAFNVLLSGSGCPASNIFIRYGSFRMSVFCNDGPRYDPLIQHFSGCLCHRPGSHGFYPAKDNFILVGRLRDHCPVGSISANAFLVYFHCRVEYARDQIYTRIFIRASRQ